MAKPTKGKGEKADKPETVEEAVQDAVETVVQDDDAETPIEDAEILDEAVVDPAPEEDGAVDAAPLVATEVERETVVERKGGFLPLVLGGVVAAGIGVASAQYIFPNGLPFGPAATEKVDLASALKLQTGRIDDLTALLESQPKVDTAALDAAVSAVGDLQAQIGAVVDNVSALETRIVTLEQQPGGGDGVSVAMENELKELRAALDVQKGELAKMLDEAQSTKQSAEETARQTLARAAVTRILVALESGAAFDDALADVEANSDIALPEALAPSAADGVPTLAALSESYPDAARAALAAVRSEETGGGVGSFFAKQLGVRSVAPRDGDDPDAVLSRVEAAVGEGRIADALSLADGLPDAAKAPLADWMARANLRLSAAREAEALANSLNSQ
ncbi:MAG: hypothetical protein WBC85_10285 [Planktotalea sp.]|uniref:COG4223 family protein n=1 Tax=Planktotalea sp. TaxID=2029877 RepID=UPI003C77B8A8